MPQLSFQQLCTMIWDDPISAAPTIQHQHRSHRHRKYELAVAGYVLAIRLSKDPDLIEAFYALPFFQAGFKRNPLHLLLHCLQFVYEDRLGSDSDRAGDHARALQRSWNVGADPFEVLEALKSQGGFSGLQVVYEPSFLPRAQTMPIPQAGTQSSHLLSAEEMDPSPEPPLQRPAPCHGGAEGEPSRREPKKPKLLTAKEMLKQFLLVDVGPLYEDHVVFAMKVGDRRQILLERLPDGSRGLARYRGHL